MLQIPGATGSIVATPSTEYQQEEYLGKLCTVVPAILVTSGIYMMKKENAEPSSTDWLLALSGPVLKRSLRTWDGSPLIMIEEAYARVWSKSVGAVFNTHFCEENCSLTADLVVFNVEGAKIVDAVREGKPVNLSISAFSDTSPRLIGPRSEREHIVDNITGQSVHVVL